MLRGEWKEEMLKTNRRKVLLLFSVVAIASVLGTWYVTASAADTGEENSNDFSGICEWLRVRIQRRERYRLIEVSEEYEATVITIAESDDDVQGLLAEGYTILGVRPVIKSMVDADGDVTAKAINAIVVLEQDTTNHAAVWVNLDEARVTKIVIVTRTVIEK